MQLYIGVIPECVCIIDLSKMYMRLDIYRGMGYRRGLRNQEVIAFGVALGKWSLGNKFNLPIFANVKNVQYF